MDLLLWQLFQGGPEQLLEIKSEDYLTLLEVTEMRLVGS